MASDAEVAQALDLLHNLAGARTGDHALAQLGVGGVDRDVERAEALLREALPIMLFEVGEGNEVAEEEAVAVVVVFDVERVAHAEGQAALGRVTLGQAVYEAEDALVGTDADEGRRLLAKEDAQVASRLLARLTRQQDLVGAAVALDAQRQLVLGGMELVVHQVAHGTSVDGAQQVARLDAGEVGGAAGHDLTHPSIELRH